MDDAPAMRELQAPAGFYGDTDCPLQAKPVAVGEGGWLVGSWARWSRCEIRGLSSRLDSRAAQCPVCGGQVVDGIGGGWIKGYGRSGATLDNQPIQLGNRFLSLIEQAV